MFGIKGRATVCVIRKFHGSQIRFKVEYLKHGVGVGTRVKASPNALVSRI